MEPIPLQTTVNGGEPLHLLQMSRKMQARTGVHCLFRLLWETRVALARRMRARSGDELKILSLLGPSNQNIPQHSEALSPMHVRIALVFLALLAPASSIHIKAQNAPGTLQGDPMALMTLAHDKNGLVGPDIKPWHIRGTYHSFETKGKLPYEGTYEEWWVNATKYKLSFTNPKSTQTDYATGEVLLRDGSQEWQSGPELLLLASLLEPLPGVSQLREFTLQHWVKAIGQSNIECVGLTYPVRPSGGGGSNFYPVACFGPATPALRIYSVGTSIRIVYDGIVSFQDHYLARQIQVFENGTLAADLNIDVVETLKVAPDTVLTPSATAFPVDLTKIQFKAGTTSRWPTLLKKAVPEYPQEARTRHIQGEVNINATIGPDGHVKSMKPIDGPSMLRQSALDAVHQWLYRPFDLMGQPRIVEVEVHVIFTLG
jgi:TonB family protein